jgi:hypothetical protein
VGAAVTASTGPGIPVDHRDGSPDPAVKAQAAELIRLLEASGCIFHDEWYPNRHTARLRYTSPSENHDQMWDIEVQPWVRR